MGGLTGECGRGNGNFEMGDEAGAKRWGIGELTEKSEWLTRQWNGESGVGAVGWVMRGWELGMAGEAGDGALGKGMKQRGCVGIENGWEDRGKGIGNWELGIG